MFAFTTERLLLRDVLPEDAAPLHQLHSDPAATRYCAYLAAERQEQTEAWLRQTMQDNAQVPRREYYLAMVRQADGCVMSSFRSARPANQLTVSCPLAMRCGRLTGGRGS